MFSTRKRGLDSFSLDEDFAGRQVIGSRAEQQDAYAFSTLDGKYPLLLVLADGMGGHNGGCAAANAAVQGFVNGFHINQRQGDESSDIQDSLKRSLSTANEAVDTLIRSDEETLLEAGTTLLAVACSKVSICWISVGDSPLFLWRKNSLTRLNEDHSMRAVLAQKVADCEMAPKDIETHPERNVLLSALNGMEPEKVDAPQKLFPAEPGDVFLAASDGILSLTEPQIESVLKKNSKKTAAQITRVLLEKVVDQKVPKQDNATIAIIKI